MMANAADKEQIAMLSRWWGVYGKSIIIAIALALVVVFGWRYWLQYKEEHSAKASLVYQSLFSALAAKDAEDVNKTVSKLKQKFQDTPYASLGAMLAARFSVEAHNYPAALAQLKWVIEKAKVDSFRQLARMSMAQLLLAQKQYTDAQHLLQVVDDKTFQPCIDNLLGQIYLAQGNLLKASQAFQSAKMGFQGANIDDSLINMQLNAITS